MNYITTNIRFPEDMYIEIKMEALRKRMSLAALVRDKFSSKTTKKNKRSGAAFRELERIAKDNARYMKGKSLSDLLIQMRYEQ